MRPTTDDLNNSIYLCTDKTMTCFVAITWDEWTNKYIKHINHFSVTTTLRWLPSTPIESPLKMSTCSCIVYSREMIQTRSSNYYLNKQCMYGFRLVSSNFFFLTIFCLFSPVYGAKYRISSCSLSVCKTNATYSTFTLQSVQQTTLGKKRKST